MPKTPETPTPPFATLLVEVRYEQGTFAHRADLVEAVREGLDNLRQYGEVTNATLEWPPQPASREDVTHLF